MVQYFFGLGNMLSSWNNTFNYVLQVDVLVGQ